LVVNKGDGGLFKKRKQKEEIKRRNTTGSIITNFAEKQEEKMANYKREALEKIELVEK
jgi:hypothetical protein